jgi:hypothetical protein
MARIKFSVYIFMLFSLLQTSCGKEGFNSPKTSGAGGSLARFAIQGNYLYIVDFQDLNVYRIDDPTNPVYIGKRFIGFDVETIFPYGDKLFIGGQNGMYIFSVAQPDNPVKEGSIAHFRACDPVVSNDSIAYVTLRNAGPCGGARSVLNVYNVKDIKNPIHINEVGMRSPHGLGIKQNALYVCEGGYGMVVFDLKNPVNPAKKMELKDEVYYDVIPYGNILIAYIENGIALYDILDPLNPKLLSKLKN